MVGLFSILRIMVDKQCCVIKIYALRCIFLIIFFLVFLKPDVAIAQQYFIKSYGAENGLSTRLITDACQDKDGYMWFSSYLGISRYDGFSFINYDTTTGLPAQHYRKIKCDEKGILWAVPFINAGKIVYFKNGTWNTFDVPISKPPYQYITSFAVLYKNCSPVICVGSYNGIDLYQNSTWKHFNISDEKTKNIVYNVTVKNSAFYLSTELGIGELENEKINWKLNQKVNPAGRTVIATRFENPGLPKEKMWILTVRSIGYFQHGRYTQVADNFLLEDIGMGHFPYLEISKNGNIIFGNNFSKYLLKTTTNEIIPLKIMNGFSSNGASSVFIDREENIWVSDNRGIDKISNITLVNYFTTSGLPENEVTALVEINDGEFVLGHNNRISIFKDQKFKVLNLPGYQNILTRVLDIMKDNAGNVWFSANTLGVGKLTKDEKIHWYPSLNNFRATSIFQDNAGRMWIGSNSKLYYMKGNTIVEYEHNALLLNNGIRKIFGCYTGGVYVSSTNGFWKITNDTAIRLKTEDDSRQFNSFSYYRDKKGTEFIGTMNGLFFVDKGIIKRYQTKNLNIINPIYFILQDRDDFYWFGTNNGVLRWDGSNDPEVYNMLNGLAGLETNRSAGLLDSEGRVWVGTDKGLSCFTPGKERLKTPTPTVILLYAETNSGEKYPLNLKCSIKNSDNTLTFHFRGISFVNEELLTYKYKLEGYDKDWREATQAMLDKIKYVNLKPGKYRLCVTAKNYSSSWSKEVYSEEITIGQPWYLSWSFKLIMIFLLVLILWIIHSVFSQRLINHTLKKEIAERKLAEENLKESEQRLSFIIEGSRLGTWDWDIETNVVFRNFRCIEIAGYTIGESIQSQQFWTNLIHPDDKARAASAMQQHLEGKTQLLEVDYRILTKSKKYIWVQERAKVVQHNAAGKPTRMSGTINDINQRKNAADALQRSEERLRLLLGSLPVAIFIAPVDPGVDLLMITGNVEAITGYTEKEFLAEPDFWRKRLHPDDRERVLNGFEEAKTTGGISIEYRWQMANGNYKWIHDQSILKTEGTKKEYLGVFVDINELKLAELEITNKNEQLKHLNAEKDKLFSIISHDLRSPVTGFLGLTSMLMEELSRLDTSQIKGIASSLYNSASKVNDLLNDLLEWSQLQRGLTLYTPSQINLKQSVDECSSIIFEQAKAKKIQVNNEISDEVKVIADSHMLQVVLRNLLTNAVKFTPKGGSITVSVTSGNNDSAKISVKDTGIGIDSDLLGKLFKVNEKTSRKGTDGEPSSGLGLILCWEFVEHQKGKLWAESEVGKGSTFHFTVPVPV
jgi:PAS domain S-box-containing protein